MYKCYFKEIRTWYWKNQLCLNNLIKNVFKILCLKRTFFLVMHRISSWADVVLCYVQYSAEIPELPDIQLNMRHRLESCYHWKPLVCDCCEWKKWVFLFFSKSVFMCEEKNGYPVSGLDRIPLLDVFEVARYPVSIRCIPNIVHQKEIKVWKIT